MNKRHQAPSAHTPSCLFAPVKIKSADVLRSAYLPFLKNGGILVSTTRPCEIGDQVFLLIRLFDEKERIAQIASVVWKNPDTGSTEEGHIIGVRFNDGEARTGEKLEQILAQEAG